MKYIKYYVSFFFLILLLFSFTGCTFQKNKSEELNIVTTIFPLYDFTKQIVKDKATVTLILPPGVEPHSYDPKPRDIFNMRETDMFIYTGDFLEVWASKLKDVLKEDDVLIINSSQNISLHQEEEDHGNLFHSHESYDPHVWLDPYNAMSMVDEIVKGLIQVDPENKAFYEQNALNYKNELKKLDEAYLDLFTYSKYKTIIFGGHFVFGYLASRYEIDYLSPYPGFSPDTLPTPKKMQELVKRIEKTGQKTIFYEELINPKVAEVISSETNAVMLPLNGAGNISKEDYLNHVTYLEIMYQNIENLKKGLHYNG